MSKKPSNPITPELRDLIKRLLATGAYFQHQIAAMLGLNQGRISEVKNGLYD